MQCPEWLNMGRGSNFSKELIIIFRAYVALCAMFYTARGSTTNSTIFTTTSVYM